MNTAAKVGALALLLFGATVAPALAEGASVSFAGKRVNFSIGFSPIGIGYDTYGRFLAKHLSKYLPGNPLVVPQNRPGAGSLNLMNHIYNVAARDGTEIALVGRGAAMDPLVSGGASSARFDATKLTWIGSMNNEVAGFFIANTAPAKSLKEILGGTPIQVGSTGGGGDPQIFASTLNAIMKTRMKIIAGYPGMNEILLGMNRGELDGVLGYSWGTARMGSRDQLKDGTIKLIMQLALQKHPELPDIPLVMDLVPDGEGKRVLELIFARQSMGRPVVAPPGLDPNVTAVLRKAFAAAMRDPEFVAECEKINLEISYVSGEDVEALVRRLYSLPASVIAEARRIVAAKQ